MNRSNFKTQMAEFHKVREQLAAQRRNDRQANPGSSPTSPEPRPGEERTSPTSLYRRGSRFGSETDQPRQPDWQDPGVCSHGVTIGARCSKCGGVSSLALTEAGVF